MGRPSKKKTGPVTEVKFVLNVCTSRNGTEYVPQEFVGTSYDNILDIVWEDPGLDRIDLDSQLELMKLAKIDRERAAALAEEERLQEEQDRLRAEEIRKASRQKTGPKPKVVDYLDD